MLRILLKAAALHLKSRPSDSVMISWRILVFGKIPTEFSQSKHGADPPPVFPQLTFVLMSADGRSFLGF